MSDIQKRRGTFNESTGSADCGKFVFVGDSRKNFKLPNLHAWDIEARMITTLKRNCESISLIIPVVNEASNIRRLLDGVANLPRSKLTDCIKEIVFVDDGSTDGTPSIIKDSAGLLGGVRVVLKQRAERHGTVNAQLFGMSQASNDVVIVMDGDLQHPVKYLPDLVSKYMEGYDLVIASRYVNGGSAQRTLYHALVSRGANLAAKVMLSPARRIRDPISGYFIVNRQIINTMIEPNGHNKLALYILSGTKRISVAEIPYSFVERSSGYSKVSSRGTDYIRKYLDELRLYRHFSRKKVQKPASGKEQVNLTSAKEP